MDIEKLPSGTVTFLFTDIEGSTRLWQEKPEGMSLAHARHDVILREAIESNHGYIFQIVGDSFSAAFHNALDGLCAALAAQRALQIESWDKNPTIKVRMGLHTGNAEIRPDSSSKYDGYATIASTQRVMSVANGGQILLSQTTHELVQNDLPDSVLLLDMGEHYLKDLRTPLRLYQLIAPNLEQDFPPIQSLNAFPNNLPVQLTSFIGREREINEAGQLFSSTRLLTFIGPGGTGKTRLSLQVAAEQLVKFKDGVWLVELAALTDPALIMQSIASVFHLRMQMGMPLHEIVLDFLRAKNLLLILDNCEHLIEECAHLVDQILRSSPRIKFMASSRETLGISGETIYRVPSLSVPARAEATRDALQRYESVQLFAERARAANPKFELTDQNASSVAQICSRLDGIPLALELAAARASIFSTEQIATRLDDRFKLLTGGSRTALPRQQTLRALIDWSYDILSDNERILLRRLSVFAGGWTFEAAEAVSPDLDVLDLLTQLVNKSLVIVDEQSMDTRYYLLETIRQYARDKLLESGEAEQARNAHLEYFVAFSERVNPLLDSKEVLLWIPRVDADYDNFRVAFEWGLEHNVEACLRLVGSLAYFWFRRGHGAEGIQMATAALERAHILSELNEQGLERAQMIIHARAFQAMAFLCYSQGDNQKAYKAGERCIAYARQLDDPQMLATVLAFSGSARLFEGDFVTGRKEIEEAVALTRLGDDKYVQGMALGMMAQVEMIVNHDLKAAEKYEQRALILTREISGTWTSLMMYFGIGRGAMFRGDYAVARERFAYCLPLFEEMKDEHRMNMIHSELAHMDRYEGKLQQAEDAYRQTIIVWQKIGHRAAVAHQLECFAFLAKAHEESERALRLLGAAEILRERINIHMQPLERREYEREVTDLRASMSEDEFKTLWAEGRSMSMDEAIAFALA